MDGTRAWYTKALKIFFTVCSCTTKAVSGNCRCWWSAGTSVSGASIEVDGAGLLADACHMLLQDAELYALLAIVGLTDGRDCHLEATIGPRQVSFGEWLLKFLRGSRGWPSSPSPFPHFPRHPLLLCLFLHHFLTIQRRFASLIPLVTFSCSPSPHATRLSLSPSYSLFHLSTDLSHHHICRWLLQPNPELYLDPV